MDACSLLDNNSHKYVITVVAHILSQSQLTNYRIHTNKQLQAVTMNINTIDRVYPYSQSAISRAKKSLCLDAYFQRSDAGFVLKSHTNYSEDTTLGSSSVPSLTTHSL